MTKFECLYCGHKFVYRSYYDYNDEPRCPECKDTALRESKDDKADIYGYKIKKD